MDQIPQTVSTTFLIRAVKQLITKEELIKDAKLLNSIGFKNAFIGVEGHETYIERPLYLLCKPPDMATFNEFINAGYQDENLIEDFDFPGGFVCLLYQIPFEYRHDYRLVVDGRYSEISKDYQKLFPSTYKNGGKYLETLTSLIFRKSPEYQKEREQELGLEEGFMTGMELYDKFDINKEILKIKDLINYDNRTIKK